jgi:VanZ family protein
MADAYNPLMDMSTGAGRRVGLWLPPLVYAAVIFYLSSQSAPLPELTEHVWDKFLHTIEYAGLGLLVCRALVGEGIPWVRAAILAVAISSVYGASDEWHQSFVPDRSSDVRDWITDNIGATLGAGCYAATALAVARRYRA